MVTLIVRRFLRIVSVLVFVGSATLALPSAGSAQIIDDFSSATIDLTKWEDASSNVVRRLAGGMLESSINQVGPVRSNSLFFVDPDSVTSIRADITVTDASFVGAGSARARIQGQFYNDGTGGAGQIGDVSVRLEIRADSAAPAGMLRVRIGIERCNNADCSDSTEVAVNTTAFGPVTLGSTHTAGVEWDGNRTFTFTFDNQPPLVLGAADGVPAFGGPAKGPFRRLATTAGVFPAGSEGGAIRALFDNVFKNGVLFEDFTGPTLDPAKWANNQEFVKRNTGGVFESAIARFGSAGNNNLLLLQPELVTSLAADVTVTAVRNSGAEPKAWLIGFFYNDGTAGTGSVGDVVAAMQVEDAEDGSGLRAVAGVGRCTNADCSTVEEFLDDKTTFGPVALGTTHRLLLSFDGTTFTFGFDAARLTFTPGAAAPNAGPPKSTVKGIGTRVSEIDSAAEGGFISATFDNFDGSLAAAPTLSLQLNQGAFQTGQSMTVTATLTPGNPSRTVDAYVVIQLPNGSFLSLTAGGVASGIVPLVPAFTPVAFAGPILNYTFTGAEPAGTYTWLSALTEAGTGTIIGTIDQDAFTFTP
jgi:hypothetical protein